MKIKTEQFLNRKQNFISVLESKWWFLRSVDVSCDLYVELDLIHLMWETCWSIIFPTQHHIKGASVSGQSNNSVGYWPKVMARCSQGHLPCTQPVPCPLLQHWYPVWGESVVWMPLGGQKTAFWMLAMRSGCGSLLWGSTAAFCPHGFSLVPLILCEAVSWCSQKIYAPSFFET